MRIRSALTAIALAFVLYQAARGMVWTLPPVHPLALVLAVLCYVAVALSALLVSAPASEREAGAPELPRGIGVLALLSAAGLPLLTEFAVDQPVRGFAVYDAWDVGAVGALMVIVMVRRRRLLAWAGTALLTAVSVWRMGLFEALAHGLVGSLLWVAVAHILVVLFERARRDAARLAQLQSMTSAWQASQDARERERRVQLRQALAVGGPVLQRVIAMHGVLRDEERREAVLAEARLRDELRGPLLLDDGVREAIDVLRRRGVQVSVFDEGGLEQLAPEALRRVRRDLTRALAAVESGQVIIRSAPEDPVVVTVVAREGDDVALWRELRPAP